MLFGAWPLGGKIINGPTKRGTIRFLLLLGSYMIFLVVGAAIFSAIEAPKIEELSKKVNQLRTKFLQKNECLNAQNSLRYCYCVKNNNSHNNNLCNNNNNNNNNNIKYEIDYYLYKPYKLNQIINVQEKQQEVKIEKQKQSKEQLPTEEKHQHNQQSNKRQFYQKIHQNNQIEQDEDDDVVDGRGERTRSTEIICDYLLSNRRLNNNNNNKCVNVRATIQNERVGEKKSLLLNNNNNNNNYNTNNNNNNNSNLIIKMDNTNQIINNNNNNSGNVKEINENYKQNNNNNIKTKRKRRRHICLIFFIIIYCIYLLMGGLIFQIVEIPAEKIFRENIRNVRTSFMEKYPNIKDDDLEDLIALISKANDRGISALKNASSEFNWSFGQSLFFSSTVITTIGYGHVTPLSQTGKIFCMIYATIGIPLTLVLLSAVVERLLIPTNWLLGSLNSRLGHLYQPFNIRLLHLTILLFIIGTLFFGIPTFVFAYLEPTWGLLDAFYYCFISMTTIGLGDYIPGDTLEQPNRALYKVLTTCYLFVGLMGMMLALTVFYDIPQLNLGQLFTETNAGDSEKLRLSGGGGQRCYSGPSGLYIPQRDEEVRRAVVRIRPRGDEDSPSPEDDKTPMHARDIRVP